MSKNIKLNQDQSIERMGAEYIQNDIAEKMEALDLNFVFLWGKQYGSESEAHSLNGTYFHEHDEKNKFIEALEGFIKKLKEVN